MSSCSDSQCINLCNYEQLQINKQHHGKKYLVLSSMVNSLFENHVSSLCRKASQKLHALNRLVNYMNLSKQKALMKTFALSQFNYCPLVWIFHSRKLNNRTNQQCMRCTQRCISITNPHFLNYYETIMNYHSVTIHQRSLQVFATGMFQVRSVTRNYKRSF